MELVYLLRSTDVYIVLRILSTHVVSDYFNKTLNPKGTSRTRWSVSRILTDIWFGDSLTSELVDIWPSEWRPRKWAPYIFCRPFRRSKRRWISKTIIFFNLFLRNFTALWPSFWCASNHPLAVYSSHNWYTGKKKIRFDASNDAVRQGMPRILTISFILFLRRCKQA